MHAAADIVLARLDHLSTRRCGVRCHIPERADQQGHQRFQRQVGHTPKLAHILAHSLGRRLRNKGIDVSATGAHVKTRSKLADREAYMDATQR